MDTETLKAIQSIVYYVDEYKKGNPDVDQSIMKMIAKETKKLTKRCRLEYIYYHLTLGIVKLRAILLSPEALEDNRYSKYVNLFESDLETYLNLTLDVKDYIDMCIKTKNYDELDTAYVLAVDLIQMLQALPMYTDEIVKVLDSSSSWIKAIYPEKDYSEVEQRKEDIKLLYNKIKSNH